MKKIQLITLLVGMLAFIGSAQAIMTGGSGGSGMTIGSTGTVTGSSGTMGTYMQMPTTQQMFSYGPTTGPVMGTDISSTMPIGVGTVAMGGNMINVHVAIGQFSNPMDLYLTVYAPAIDPFNLYLIHPDGTIKPVSEGFEPWMAGVTSVDQTPVPNMPTSELTPGTYTVGLMATPTGGNTPAYYMWTTNFVVQ